MEVNIVSVSFLRAEGRHATNGSLPYLLKLTALSLAVETRDEWSLSNLALECATGQWYTHICISPYRNNSRCNVASALSVCSFERLMFFCQAKMVVKDDRIQVKSEIFCLSLKLFMFCRWHDALALCLPGSSRMSARMSFWIICVPINGGQTRTSVISMKAHEGHWTAVILQLALMQRNLPEECVWDGLHRLARK